VVKTDKQFKYAEKKNINFVIMINENELSKELISIKNILTGEKQLISLEEIVKLFL
jgi:histidyl-tRNA synthetase